MRNLHRRKVLWPVCRSLLSTLNNRLMWWPLIILCVVSSVHGSPHGACARHSQTGGTLCAGLGSRRPLGTRTGVPTCCSMSRSRCACPDCPRAGSSAVSAARRQRTAHPNARLTGTPPSNCSAQRAVHMSLSAVRTQNMMYWSRIRRIQDGGTFIANSTPMHGFAPPFPQMKTAPASVTANRRVPHTPFHHLSVPISPKSLVYHSTHSCTQSDTLA
jgi:hypothetical protein